jgi:nitrate reductase gamma subunit
MNMESHEPSSLLATIEVIHWAALGVMGLVYALRLRWLFSFKAAKDRSAPGQPDRTNAKRGGYHSLANVAMPWAMESTRQGTRLIFWTSFVLFHLGVAAGIGLAFISTVAPGVLRIPEVAWTVGGVIFGAFLVALYRIARRVARPVMRLISSPDDYFSLVMLTAWFALGVVTQAHIAGVERFHSENWLIAYLLLTSFFLLYVPFSKISHYLYYPFSRWWIGKALGHRGSYPYSRA